MKPIKKLLVVALAAAMMFSTFASIGAATFPDITDPDVLAAATGLSQVGVLTGYPDGTFRPGEAVTRAQMATIVVRSLGLDYAAKVAKGATKFPDVGADHWACGYVTVATNCNVIRGYADGTFRPDATVTFNEAITMLIRALGGTYVTQADALPWPTGYINVAKDLGITAAVEPVLGGMPATRGEVALMAHPTVFTVKVDGVTLVEKLYVYGNPAAVTVEATPASVVANGKSELTVTGKVVDSLGRQVRDFEGDLEITMDVPGVFTLADGEKAEKAAVVGAATWKFVVGDIAGVAVEFSVAIVDNDEIDPGTGTASTTAQVATSLSVSADPNQLSCDGQVANISKVTAKVMDQAGVQMKSGAWNVTFSISGPGTWTDKTVADETVFTGVDYQASIDVITKLNQPGVIKVTATATGLTGGSATVSAAIATTPTKLAVVVSDSPIAGDDTETTTVTVKLLDANGHLVTMEEFDRDDLRVTISPYDEVTTTPAHTDGVIDFEEDGLETAYGRFTFDLSSMQLSTVSITASGDGLSSASATVAFVVGEPYGVSVTPTDPDEDNPGTVAILLPAANPTAVITAQVVDAGGNPVAAAEYEVAWSVDTTYGGSGVIVSKDEETNASGIARATFAVAGDGAAVMATVTPPEGEDPLSDDDDVSGAFAKAMKLPEKVKLRLLKMDGTTVTATVKAGEKVYAEADVQDIDGDPIAFGPTGVAWGIFVKLSITPDTAGEFDVSGEDTIILPLNDDTIEYIPTWTLLTGMKAGSAVVKAELISVLAKRLATRGLSVTAGAASQLMWADVPGMEELDTTAGDYYTTEVDADEVYKYAVEIQDAGGNPASLSTDTNITISVITGDADLREKADGVSYTILSLTIKKGASKVYFYVVPETFEDHPDPEVDLCIELSVTDTLTAPDTLLLFEAP